MNIGNAEISYPCENAAWKRSLLNLETAVNNEARTRDEKDALNLVSESRTTYLTF